MAITYTKEQTRVIEARDHNILVSAAAGSGKTAVLVERIVRMISEGEHPRDIDRLLVVTFTKAAAAQMRERIGEAIARKIEEDPQNAHLQRQETLLHNAQITTMDSFFTFVLRNNFSDIDMDPGFRQMDQTETDLMRKDTLEEFLEEGYEKADPSLLLCEKYFCRGASDKELESVIETLYRQAVSRPDPEGWIRERAADYNAADEKELLTSVWMQFAILTIADRIRDLSRQYTQLYDDCLKPGGPHPYLPLIRAEMESFRRLSSVPGTDKAGSLTADEIRGILGLISESLAVEFARAPVISAKKYPDVDPDQKDSVKDRRDKIKKTIGKINTSYRELDPESILSDMKLIQPVAEALSDLAVRFISRFKEVKREKNVIDFVDLEHYALQILTEKAEDGTYRPRRAAAAYRQYFDEILIDEYQDSNDIQELLLRMISTEDEKKYNRFMVGDVKQSIYKFRLARPEIFMQKLDTYRKLDNETERIDLDNNFRSRHEVLDSVNDVFSRLMRREIGGVEYDDSVSLKAGAAYPALKDPAAVRTELLILDDPKEEQDLLPDEIKRLNPVQKEALAVAGKIKELAGSLPVRAEDGQLRPCRFGDIVVLLRTAKGWSEEFRRVFEAEGIPYYIESRTGYFSAKEIRTVLELMRVFDNPRQDIPLYGALRGFFGAFSEEEAARIRLCEPERGCDLYTCLSEAADPGDSSADTSPDRIVLRDKCRKFLQFLDRWRRRALYLPIRDLLTQLFMETGYEEWCRALPGGEQRTANLRMLMAQALSFDNMGLNGLFDFVRYIDQMHHREVDYGEANTLDENADVVRIMSIHKSKGLEFPVCIVAGMTKEYSYRSHEVGGAVICDSDWGIGIDQWDPAARARFRDFRKEAIADKIRRDSLGEELRVLYVAMTRAKEKLILTGYLRDAEKKCGDWEKKLPAAMGPGEKLPAAMISESVCYLELIWYAVRSPGGSMHIDVRTLSCADLSLKKADLHAGMAKRKEAIEKYAFDSGINLPDPALEQALRTIYSRRYAFENLRGLYTKTSVSELKAARLQEEEGEGALEMFPENIQSPVIPDFASQEAEEKKGFTGTGYGTAVHKLLELFDYKRFSDPAKVSGAEFDSWREELFMGGKIPRSYAEKLGASGILRFLGSPLAARMARADERGELYREQPFVLGIEADSINPDFPHDETVLIQGIIDACFLEENEFVLVDYKTDRVDSSAELRDRYRVQLDLYERALSQITGRKVREKLIYSVSLGAVIRL